MIKAKIAKEYPNHVAKCLYSDKSLYLADYTNQTNSARGVEIFSGTPPTDIGYFTLQNDVNLKSCSITFDNTSFTRPDGSPLSQCECVVFPKTSDVNSWILFVELKYSSETYHNNSNLKKAIEQLCKTRTYYYRKRIFLKTNPCYLLASLPKQAEPFPNTIISQVDLIGLKRKYNIILRFVNRAEIQNDRVIRLDL